MESTEATGEDDSGYVGNEPTSITLSVKDLEKMSSIL